MAGTIARLVPVSHPWPALKFGLYKTQNARRKAGVWVSRATPASKKSKEFSTGQNNTGAYFVGLRGTEIRRKMTTDTAIMKTAIIATPPQCSKAPA